VESRGRRIWQLGPGGQDVFLDEAGTWNWYRAGQRDIFAKKSCSFKNEVSSVSLQMISYVFLYKIRRYVCSLNKGSMSEAFDRHPAWLCIGDFNETLFASEHLSRTERPEWQMRAFREVVEDCSLHDLGWPGVEYTWDNGQVGDANVKARLDRAFGDDAFVNRFAHSRVRHIVSAESDHSFVLVDFSESENDERIRGTKQFRYEDVWQSHADYDQLVLDKWQKGAGQQGLIGVVQALKKVQTNLAEWGAKEFGCLARKI
jgi:hypothetical protein